MPLTRSSSAGSVGPTVATHFISYVSFDPSTRRPFVCISMPASAPPLTVRVYDDTDTSSYEMAIAYLGSAFDLFEYSANGVAMVMS